VNFTAVNRFEKSFSKEKLREINVTSLKRTLLLYSKGAGVLIVVISDEESLIYLAHPYNEG
jgi:predicted regulator of Ras-like GTPase activity (Roadblock/LC7/MglB family)